MDHIKIHVFVLFQHACSWIALTYIYLDCINIHELGSDYHAYARAWIVLTYMFLDRINKRIWIVLTYMYLDRIEIIVLGWYKHTRSWTVLT